MFSQFNRLQIGVFLLQNISSYPSPKLYQIVFVPDRMNGILRYITNFIYNHCQNYCMTLIVLEKQFTVLAQKIQNILCFGKVNYTRHSKTFQKTTKAYQNTKQTITSNTRKLKNKLMYIDTSIFDYIYKYIYI